MDCVLNIYGTTKVLHLERVMVCAANDAKTCAIIKLFDISDLKCPQPGFISEKKNDCTHKSCTIYNIPLTKDNAHVFKTQM